MASTSTNDSTIGTPSGSIQLPLLEEATEYRDIEKKPSWRGLIHAGTLPIVMVLGTILIMLSIDRGWLATTASAVYTGSAMALFGVSATYHRFGWGPQAKSLLRRLDHANIFFLIAGTYTPISLLALDWPQSIILLSVVWSGAIVGIVFRVVWISAPRWMYVPLYLALGWAAVMYLPQLLSASVAMVVMVLVGGILYSLGAIVYGIKKPNPLPDHFGFHEVFHTLTVLAFICHWVAVLLIVLNPLS
jgi:hemolysin III